VLRLGRRAGRCAAALRPDGDYGAFPPRIEFEGERLVLNGSGLCEWGFLGVDLYRAALYRPEATRDAATVIAASTRSILHLHFVRGLTKGQLQKAYTASVEANAGDRLPRFGSGLDALCAKLTQVDKGGSLTYVIDPGRGIEVLVDGLSRGSVEDPAFARLFLELHVGDKPPTQKLKAGLLGG